MWKQLRSGFHKNFRIAGPGEPGGGEKKENIPLISPPSRNKEKARKVGVTGEITLITQCSEILTGVRKRKNLKGSQRTKGTKKELRIQAWG